MREFLCYSLKHIQQSGFKLVLLIICCSCRLGEIAPPESGKEEYYPLELGRYVVYDVEKITFNPFDDEDTLRIEVFEAIVDTFSGLDHDFQYRIQQWTRPAGSESPWKPDSVFSVRKEQNRLVKTESNIPYVKLIFPLLEDSKWDGNLLNIKPQQEYTVADYLEPKTILRTVFDKTITIIQQNDTSLIRDDFWHEVYAEGTGMVEKSIITYVYRQEDGSVVEPREISSGQQALWRFVRGGIAPLPVKPQ